MWLNMKPYTDQSNKAMATKYIIGISDKKNFIDQQRDMIHLKPGHHMMIKVLPRLVRTTTDFNELQRSQRKCKLSQETDGFSFLKQYSRKGCQFECAIKMAVQICKCIPWYYPNDFKEWPICDMFGGHCFEIIMEDSSYYQKCKGQCITDCHETAYMVIWSTFELELDSTCNGRGFHNYHFKHTLRKHFAFYNYKTLVEGGSIPELDKSYKNGSLCRDYVKNYGAFVSVEGGNTRIIVTNRDRRIFFYDQLGTFGGTLGLFVGMSVVSFFEVAFLIFNLTNALINSLIAGPKRIIGYSEKKDYPSLIQIKMEKIEYHLKVNFTLYYHFEYLTRLVFFS